MFAWIYNRILDFLCGPIEIAYRRCSDDYQRKVGFDTFTLHSCLRVTGRKRLMPKDEDMVGGVMLISWPNLYGSFLNGKGEDVRFVEEGDDSSILAHLRVVCRTHFNIE